MEDKTALKNYFHTVMYSLQFPDENTVSKQKQLLTLVQLTFSFTRVNVTSSTK